MERSTALATVHLIFTSIRPAPSVLFQGDSSVGVTRRKQQRAGITKNDKNISTIKTTHQASHKGFALRCWLCSASTNVMVGHVYGALLVAVLVVR